MLCKACNTYLAVIEDNEMTVINVLIAGLSLAKCVSKTENNKGKLFNNIFVNHHILESFVPYVFNITTQYFISFYIHLFSYIYFKISFFLNFTFLLILSYVDAL